MAYRHTKCTFVEISTKQTGVAVNPFLPILANIIITGADRIIRFAGANTKIREYNLSDEVITKPTTTVTYNVTPVSGQGSERNKNWGDYCDWQTIYTTRTRYWTADLGSVYNSLMFYIKWFKRVGNDFWICVSSDGTTWTDVFARTEDVEETKTAIFTASNVRYVAMEAMIPAAASPSLSFYEIHAYPVPPVKETTAPAGGFGVYVVVTHDVPIEVFLLGDNIASYYIYDLDYLKVTDIKGSIEG